MIFLNRKKELHDLSKFHKFSQNKCFPIVIYGQRRVGKTRLVKEFIKNKESIYFFVNNSKKSPLLLEEFCGILKDKKYLGAFEKIISWKEFFKFIFTRLKGKTVVFDEFQNFYSVDKSIFSTIQYFIDENEDTPLMLIFLGSIVGLMKNVFEDQKQPLFGRIKSSYHLKPFNFQDSLYFLKTLGITDFTFALEFFSIFSGYPQYYVLLEDYQLQNQSIETIIEKLVLKENAILRNNVLNTLRLAFGNGKANYYAILEAIGSGHTKQSQIANYIGLSTNSTNVFLSELVHHYSFIKRNVPITEKNWRKTKKGTYEINHNFFNFYFKCIHKKIHLLELDENDRLKEIIKNNIVHIYSKQFEKLCQEYVKKEFPKLKVGSWWNRKGIEIDIVGINNEKKEILFGECKWQNNVDPEELERKLREKILQVHWEKKERNEFYFLFAKSFKHKSIRDVHCIDLKDLKDAYDC